VPKQDKETTRGKCQYLNVWMNVKLCLVFGWTMLCCPCHAWFLAGSW